MLHRYFSDGDSFVHLDLEDQMTENVIRDLQIKELVWCKGSNRLGVVEAFMFMDYQGCNLWELTDGQGKYWLCPDYLIQRLPDTK